MSEIKAKILIVDDLPQNILALEQTLGPLDIEIHTALSGNDALTKMTQHEFAVILLDVQMPGMDGFETATLMQKSKATRETPVIFVTALNKEDQYVFKGYEAGAVDCLFKPVNPDILISKVRVFINLYLAKIENKILLEEVHKRESLRSLGVLAGGLAHDFNNLLTVISGNIDLARMFSERGGNVDQRLIESSKAIKRASQLTKQLLTFSKGGTPVRQLASIRELITEITAFILSGSNCSYTVEMPDNIDTVNIDTGQISQVLQNLLINAQDAMPDGGKIFITVQNLEVTESLNLPLIPGRYVQITVTDKGTGIDNQTIDKIFDPYFSTKGTGAKKGQGLGLSVCSSIIEKHDGHIHVESELGQGSSFYIYLPATDQVIQNIVSANIIIPDTNIAEATDKSRRILVMDDEDVVRDVCGTMLITEGYDVFLTENGEDTIKFYKESIEACKRFDLIIMDLTIPGAMGGEKAVREILKIDQTAKVIVSSGYSDSHIMSNYKEYGFAASIAKPFKLVELLSLVSQVIGEEVAQQQPTS